MPKYLEEVIISVGPKQSVTTTTKGMKGASCKAATKHIEEAFGDVVSDTLTSEYHEKPVTVNQTQGQQAKARA